MNKGNMRSTLRVTKALADRQRLRILMMLRNGELCVCRIIDVLELAPSTVSKHLSILSGAELVDSRKDGRWMYYRLPDGFEGTFVRPVLKWLNKTLADDPVIVQDAKKLKTALTRNPEELCRQQRR